MSDIRITESKKLEKRFLWIERILGIILMISLISNIVMIMAFLQLTPTVRTQPFYVVMRNYADHKLKINQEDITNYIRTAEAKELILKNLVKKYVINRESFVPNDYEMNRKWGPESEIYYMSSNRVFKEFINWPIYKKGLENTKNKTRDVVLTEIVPYNNGTLWEIKGKYIDQWEPTDKQETKDFKLDIQVKLNPLNPDKTERTQNNKWKNPLGFYVEKYEHKEGIPTY